MTKKVEKKGTRKKADTHRVELFNQAKGLGFEIDPKTPTDLLESFVAQGLALQRQAIELEKQEKNLKEKEKNLKEKNRKGKKGLDDAITAFMSKEGGKLCRQFIIDCILGEPVTELPKNKTWHWSRFRSALLALYSMGLFLPEFDAKIESWTEFK